MNSRSRSLLLLLVFPAGIFAADDLPKPFNFERYQAMMDRSPFAVATAVAAPVEAPNFAKDLYVANAARSKDGDLVTIASSADKNFKKYLTTNTTVDGYSISNIEWSEKVGATKVTIAKDGQFATIAFNQALLSPQSAGGQNPPQQQQPQPVIPAPNAPAMTPSYQMPTKNGTPPTNFPKPMQVPSLPTPPPRVRGVIPRNPAVPATPPTLPVTPTPEL